MQRSAPDCFFSPTLARFYSVPAIYSLFVHISAERQRTRLTNKSLVHNYYFFRLVKSLEFIDRKMSITFCCQHGIKCHREREKSYKKIVILIFIRLVRIQFV